MAPLHVPPGYSHLILETVPAGIVHLTSDLTLVFANAEARRFLALPPRGPDSLQLADLVTRTCLEDGTPCPYESHPVIVCLRTAQAQPAATLGLRRPDGSLVWGVLTVRPLAEFRPGEAGDVVATFLDVTERRRTEQALLESQARLLALVNSLDEVVFEFDREGTVLNLWTRNEALLVRPRAQVVGRQVWQFLPPEVARLFLAVVHRVLDSGQPQSLEYELEVQSGRKWFLASISPLPMRGGGCDTLCMLARDITSRREAEEALRRSGQEGRAFQDRLRTLIEVGNMLSKAATLDDLCRDAVVLGRALLGFDRLGIWFIDNADDPAFGSFGTDEEGRLRDERGCLVRINKRQAEVIARRVRYVMDEDAQLKDLEGRLVGRGIGVTAGIWDGERVIGFVSTDNLLKRQPVTIQDCELLSLYASTFGHLCLRKRTELALLEQKEILRQDIAQRKRAEQALHESEERFRIALKNSPMVVFAQDRELRYTWMHNQPSALASEALLGRTDEELFPRDEAARLSELKRGVVASGVGVREEVKVTLGDKPHYYDLTVEPLLDECGSIIGVTCAAMDITERRRLERELLQAQKMEAIGRLAGGVAHDFNNLLTAIIGNVELMALEAEQVELPDQFLSRLDQIDQATGRASALTRQLLAFSRRQVTRLEVLDPNQVLTSMEQMLRTLIGEHIHLQVVLDRTVGRIRADSGQLEQVIMNLVVNARDAMPEGGSLRMETTRMPGGAEAPIHPVVSGPHVRISVSDTGEGMSRQVMERMFEPFFTTKPCGKGTGLGLSTVYGIVDQAGGRISVRSEPGRGTTFHVDLPAIDEPVSFPPENPPPEEERGGSETVLVCEDEDLVRSLTCRILESKGYNVLEAADARQALQRSASHQGLIHLLVTDVIMPEMNGPKLVETLAASHPQMKVLFVSGYTSDVLDLHGVSEEEISYLQKPFRPNRLLRRVREILDQ